MPRPRLHTPLCDYLGIEYPILLAGMGTLAFGAPTPPALVAAVSEAGGMGVLGTSLMNPDELLRNVREIRKLTGRPFGVDMLIPEKVDPDAVARRSGVRDQIRARFPRHWDFLQSLKREHGLEDVVVGDERAVNVAETQRQLVEILLQEEVPLFAAALGVPSWLLPRAHAQGMKVLALAGAPRHALKHRAAGVDLICAVGTEGGGHTGRIGTMPLIPQVVDAVSPTPVLAGGGIGDGRQVAAALALGAVGVWVGTAFLVAEESGIGDAAQELLIKARSQDMGVHEVYTGKPMRGISNVVVKAWEASGLETLPLPFQKVLLDDFQLAAEQAGRTELEANPGGQVVGMLTERRPAAAIVRDLVEGAIATIGGLGRAID